MKIRTFALCLGAGLVLGLVGAAQATTISQTFVQPMSLSNWSDNWLVGQFDPSLGTLNSVTISTGGQVVNGSKYENFTGTPGSVGNYLRNMNQSFAITKGTTTYLSDSYAATNQAVNYAATTAYDGSIDFAGTSGGTIPFYDSGALSGLQVYTLPVDLAPFQGTGSMTFNASITATSAISGAPNGWITANYSGAGASMTVAYDYTPVPEPASLALLTLGTAALLVRRRR